MNPLDLDLFDVWRWLLFLLCTVYTVVVTLRWAAGWLGLLSGRDRGAVLLRHYLIVQMLRLRAGAFGRELVRIGFWTAMLGGLLYLHYRLLFAA
jgi:hypothetical protein